MFFLHPYTSVDLSPLSPHCEEALRGAEIRTQVGRSRARDTDL